MATPPKAVWVVLPTYDEADNVGPISAAILEALPEATLLVVDDGLAGWHRATSPMSSPPPIRASGSVIAPRKQGLGRAYLDGFGLALAGGATIVVQMDADFSHDPATLPALIAPVAADDGGPRHRLPLHGRWWRGGLGPRPAAHLARRQPVRADRAGPVAERPDRRVQGVAGLDARGRAVRRRPCRRVRVPDRDDVPGESRRRPDPRGPDHLPRSTGRAEQDVAADRRRGPRRRRPAPGWRSCAAAPPFVRRPAIAGREPRRGVRVVIDARPLQDPDRAPLTALYLRGLLGAFDADPLEGESFAMLLQSDLDDPTDDFEHLDVVGRRQLPPTRFLRAGAMTLDPILLRGAIARCGVARRARAGPPAPSTTWRRRARCRSRPGCRSS